MFGLNKRQDVRDLELLGHELEHSEPAYESAMLHYQNIYLQLLENHRKLLTEMNLKAEFDEEVIRKYLWLVDLEEFKIRRKQVVET
jgi:hypothetical protein